MDFPLIKPRAPGPTGAGGLIPRKKHLTLHRPRNRRGWMGDGHVYLGHESWPIPTGARRRNRGRVVSAETVIGRPRSVLPI